MAIDAAWLAGYVLVGAVVGFLAGLLGMGGGMTLVPILSAMFMAQHLAPDNVVHLALGTAMASIVFTSAASVREHMRQGGVDFGVVRRMMPSMVLGSLSASAASGLIAQRHLALAFAVIVYGGAAQTLVNRKPAAARALPGTLPLAAVGFSIGIVCGLISAGGAFLTVPFMLWCGVPIRVAIGTAAMMGVPMAIVGTAGYVIAGWGVAGLPATALGFVMLPALMGLVVGSVVTAPLGARLTHRLPVPTFKRIFAFVLFALATRMLVTHW